MCGWLAGGYRSVGNLISLYWDIGLGISRRIWHRGFLIGWLVVGCLGHKFGWLFGLNRGGLSGWFGGWLWHKFGWLLLSRFLGVRCYLVARWYLFGWLGLVWWWLANRFWDGRLDGLFGLNRGGLSG